MSKDSNLESSAPRYIMSRRQFSAATAGLGAAMVMHVASAQDIPPGATPTGDPSTYPTTKVDAYVVGLHCAKEDPQMQMEAHHFCQVLADGTIQCALYDGGVVGSKLIGVEYIVSGDVFDTFPEEERQYWHPHNYEIISGVLNLLNAPDEGERGLMEMLVNSYGKTWHTWHTGRPDGEGMPGDPAPFGEPTLQWSFNRDGEADASLVASMEERLGIDVAAERESRQDLASLMQPQSGVDDLKGAFPDAEEEPPEGVEDAG